MANILNQLRLPAPLSLDVKMVVGEGQVFTSRSGINGINAGEVYKGLICYDLSNERLYQYNGDSGTNVEDDWAVVGEGAVVNVDTDTIGGAGSTSDPYSVIAVTDDNDNTQQVKLWTGTLAEYEAIDTPDDETLYNITDDYDNGIPDILEDVTDGAIPYDNNGRLEDSNMTTDGTDISIQNGGFTVANRQGGFYYGSGGTDLGVLGPNFLNADTISIVGDATGTIGLGSVLYFPDRLEIHPVIVRETTFSSSNNYTEVRIADRNGSDGFTIKPQTGERVFLSVPNASLTPRQNRGGSNNLRWQYDTSGELTTSFAFNNSAIPAGVTFSVGDVVSFRPTSVSGDTFRDNNSTPYVISSVSPGNNVSGFSVTPQYIGDGVEYPNSSPLEVLVYNNDNLGFTSAQNTTPIHTDGIEFISECHVARFDVDAVVPDGQQRGRFIINGLAVSTDGNPPPHLEIGELWLDATANSDNPILRVRNQ